MQEGYNVRIRCPCCDSLFEANFEVNLTISEKKIILNKVKPKDSGLSVEQLCSYCGKFMSKAEYDIHVCTDKIYAEKLGKDT